jgi:molybdopterin molybdotransferase
MPTFEEARRLILDHSKTLGTESVELVDSLGLVTAEDIVAPWEMPLCDNSAMDGFAVRVADCTGAVKLRVVGFIAAGGSSDIRVEPGCAIRIMTGGRIPPGCDAIVPFEEAEGREESVTIKTPVRTHQHIRFAGDDVRRGEVVIAAGAVIRAPEINMMAAFGMSRVTVFRRPRVAILSTGDELVGLGEAVAAGKVVDSNGVSLAACVKECGAIVERLGIAQDTRAAHVAKMTIGLQADIFITSAGVSVGDRDLVREVLGELGMSQVFYGIDVKPGAPTTFGVKEGRLVFCLPGNPVASMIMFDELVRPAILKTMGYRRVLRPLVRAILQEDVSKKTGLVKLLRVRLESSGARLLAFSSGDQMTGMLKTLIRADGVAILDAERTSFAAGDEVDVRVISNNRVMLEA